MSRFRLVTNLSMTMDTKMVSPDASDCNATSINGKISDENIFALIDTDKKHDTT